MSAHPQDVKAPGQLHTQHVCSYSADTPVGAAEFRQPPTLGGHAAARVVEHLVERDVLYELCGEVSRHGTAGAAQDDLKAVAAKAPRQR